MTESEHLKRKIAIREVGVRLATNAADVIGKRPWSKWQARRGDHGAGSCTMRRSCNGGCAIGLNFSPAITDDDLDKLDQVSVVDLCPIITGNKVRSVHPEFAKRVLADLGFDPEMAKCPWSAAMIENTLVLIQNAHDTPRADNVAGKVDCCRQLRDLARRWEAEAAELTVQLNGVIREENQ